jgi:hypothetical protein
MGMVLTILLSGVRALGQWAGFPLPAQVSLARLVYPLVVPARGVR